MSTDLLSPESLITRWRSSADDNPAGPLFSTPFAEADLAHTGWQDTMQTCSSCSASRTAQCC